MFPFAEFVKQWNESNQLKLTNITNKLIFAMFQINLINHTTITELSQFMLTHTDELFFFTSSEGKTKYDFRTIQNIEESEYSMTLVDFDELQEEAEEWAERQREKDEF